ncbi:MAG: zinc ribbon domain-containing protein [Phycisphaerae bacterium]
MAFSTRTQRSLLWGFISAMSACGLIGIYVLLLGHFGTLEARVLGSTAAVGGASILAMASAVSWESRRWAAFGLLGMVSTALALLFVLIMIWDVAPRAALETFGRITITACALAVSFSHVALLAMARLHRDFEWVRFATVGAIAVLAGLVLVVVWYQPIGDVWPRMIGIAAILDACGTVAVPVLHRLSRMRLRERTVTTQLQLQFTCPRCNRVQTQPAGASRCECGLRFRIEIEEEHCPRCGYSLYLAASGACPECGAAVVVPTAPFMRQGS